MLTVVTVLDTDLCAKAELGSVAADRCLSVVQYPFSLCLVLL